MQADPQASMSSQQIKAALEGATGIAIRQGKKLVGDFIPDSGTASRLVTGAGILNPRNLASLINPTLAGQFLYGAGGNLLRRGINAPNPILRGTAPITSGLLGEKAVDRGLSTTQNLLNSRLQQ